MGDRGDCFSGDEELVVVGETLELETLRQIICSKGNRCRMNSRGLRTDPWGMPWKKEGAGDLQLLKR